MGVASCTINVDPEHVALADPRQTDEPFNANRVIEDVLTITDVTAASLAKITLDPEPETWTVFVDPAIPRLIFESDAFLVILNNDAAPFDHRQRIC